MAKWAEAGYLEIPAGHIFFDDLHADIDYIVASFGARATITGHAVLHYWIYWILDLNEFPAGYKPFVEDFESELKEYKKTADMNRELFDAVSRVKNSNCVDLDEDFTKYMENYKACYGYNYDILVLIHRGYLCRKEGKDANDPEVQKEIDMRFTEQFSFLELEME
ncbi:hypothetical protein FQN55_003531 [Onygenales sp. PD_40]|nr:hypothetical protein FQN55_003531 [Onygenales sp. PD_40]